MKTKASTNHRQSLLGCSRIHMIAFRFVKSRVFVDSDTSLENENCI